MSSTTNKRERQKARRAERLAEEAAKQQRSNMQRQMLRIIGGIVALVVVGGFGFLLVQGSDVSLGVPAATVVEGTALPTIAGDLDTAIGATAPIVEGANPDGDVVTIGGEGTPQAITFVAHWCPHCQNEIPSVADWVADGNLADGVELVAVSTLQDPARPNWPPDEWLIGADFPGEIIIDSDDTAAEAYGLTGTPMWVFVDADGTVVQRLSGEISAEQLAAGSALAAGDTPET